MDIKAHTLRSALAFHGRDRVYTHWNHAAIIVDAGGDIIEALGRGVTRRSLDAYKPKEYLIVRIATAKEDRGQAVRFARWAAGEVDAASGADFRPRNTRRSYTATSRS